MSVEGSISVTVDFNDTDDGEGVDTLKKIRLASNDAYTSGKVAIVSGTCGTAGVAINPLSPGYTAADGTEVTFSSVDYVRAIAFSATPGASLQSENMNGFQLSSGQGRVANSSLPSGTYPLSGPQLTAKTIGLFGQNPTAEYSIVIYGE